MEFLRLWKGAFERQKNINKIWKDVACIGLGGGGQKWPEKQRVICLHTMLYITLYITLYISLYIWRGASCTYEGGEWGTHAFSIILWSIISWVNIFPFSLVTLLFFSPTLRGIYLPLKVSMENPNCTLLFKKNSFKRIVLKRSFLVF